MGCLSIFYDTKTQPFTIPGRAEAPYRQTYRLGQGQKSGGHPTGDKVKLTKKRQMPMA